MSNMLERSLIPHFCAAAIKRHKIMDNIKYYLKNLTEAIDKERAQVAAETKKLQESVNLGVIRKDFAKLLHDKVGFEIKTSYMGSDKNGLTFCGKTFHFHEADFLTKLTEHIKNTLKQDEEAVAKNKEINTHNSKVCDAIHVLVANCGFNTEYRTRLKSKSWIPKYESTFLNVKNYLAPFYEAAPTYDIAAREKELINAATSYLKNFNDENHKKQEEKRAKALSDPLLAEAIAYLTAQGKKVGVDFTAETAVEDANNIAFEIEVQSKREDGGPFSFGGDDCCENCDGWDGSSYRCNCGNRRVSWERGYAHSFKTPCVEAMAD